jgi:hypothetical protein
MDPLRLMIAIAPCSHCTNPMFTIKPDARVTQPNTSPTPTHIYTVVNSAWQDVEGLFTCLMLGGSFDSATYVMEWLWKTIGIGMNHPAIMNRITIAEREHLEACVPEVSGYPLMEDRDRILSLWDVGTTLAHLLVDSHNEQRIRLKSRPPSAEKVSLSLSSAALS